MGWENCHMHQFLIAGERFGTPAPDNMDFATTDVGRNRVLVRAACCRSASVFVGSMESDFGDGWGQRGVVRGYPTLEKGQKYPLCLEGARACPPEDCGGPWGYTDFLDAIKNPHNEQHEELLEWIGGEFDPEKFDVTVANGKMRSVRGRP